MDPTARPRRPVPPSALNVGSSITVPELRSSPAPVASIKPARCGRKGAQQEADAWLERKQRELFFWRGQPNQIFAYGGIALLGVAVILLSSAIALRLPSAYRAPGPKRLSSALGSSPWG